MPLLTLTWLNGKPNLDIDGKTVERVTLASVEIETGAQPVIQIEMSPEAVTHLEAGNVTWIVTCPCCGKDTDHMCTLSEGREIKPPVSTCGDEFEDGTRDSFCIRPPHSSEQRHADGSGFFW